MIRFKSFTQSARAVSLPALLLTATICAACSGASNSSSSAPGEAFEGEITSRTYMDDDTLETRYAIKGALNRVETLSSQDGAIVLIDSSLNTTTTLFPQARSY